MNGWSMDDVLAISHECPHCVNITLTVCDSTLFPFEDVRRAKEADCEFFQLILEKCPAEDNTSSSECLTLKIYCDDGVQISASWLFAGQPSSPAFAEDPESRFPVFTPVPKANSLLGGPVAGPLNLTPGSRQSFSALRGWIRQCRKHSRCKNSRDWQLPTRLINVGGNDSKDVCIYTTDDASPVEYAALSYCWGGDQDSETTCARLEERCRGFPLAELPKTIQDAIVTARRLKLPFLWVDAICIVQDDLADKEREMTIMDQIYSGALLTIIAARAGAAKDGFLQQRNLRECYGAVCRIRYRESLEGEPLPGFLAGKPLHITYDEPIDSRGWTYQERYRSFRTLRFGIKQTVWECPCDMKVDGGDDYVHKTSWSSDEFNPSQFTGAPTDRPYPYALDDPDSKLQLQAVLETWQGMIQEYSKRSLTKSKDRLPAFAALAKAFGTYLQLGPEQYLAGLWAFDICMQLQWWRPSSALEHGRCSKITGPTWSWASSDGAVEFDHPRLSTRENTLEVDHKECQIKWKSSGFKYGEVESGKLKVKGLLRRLSLTNGKFIGWHHGEQREIVLPIKAHWDCNEERDPEVWCLEISTDSSDSVGILLAKTVDNVYKRVGYFEFYHTKLIPEPIQDRLPKPGLPRNSNWFYNGGFQDIYID